MADLTSAPLPGLRADDHVRGAPDAPLLIVYGDYACPHCALAEARLAAAPVRSAFRHFALRSRHPRATALAAAAEAAAAQGAFWPFHESLFADQGRLDDPHLWARAEALGLDLDRFEADRRGPEAVERVARDLRDGLRAGVAASPTLFFDGVGHPGAPDPGWLKGLR